MTDMKNEPSLNDVSKAHHLVAELAMKLRDTLQADGPTPASVLAWLGTQPAETIRLAIIATQPRGWSAGCTMLIDSMSPDQRTGMLAALIAVWVQAR